MSFQLSKFEFCEDFGDGPLLLAHVTTDRSIIAVVSALGGFVAMAALGFPGAVFVAFAALNDFSYAGKVEADRIGGDDEPIAITDGDSTAIDVTAENVDDSIAVAPSIQHITSPVWNPAQDLGENPQSALIVGVPGSGKGMLVSNAIRTLKGKYPDLKIFVIDPKADPKERGYWEGLADRYCAFSLMNCSDPDDGAEWLLNCMTEFTAMSGPKLCIFDELMSASTELSLANKELKALSRLKKFVVGLIGQGDSQGAWLWAMTQSPQVSDMGMSGGVRANLRAIGLVSPKNMAAVEALTSTKLIPPPPGGMDELRAIMSASPVGRAVFDGKLARWLPMPKLENYSGFDRDNRSISATPSPIAPSDITGTWREDFAKNLPPGLTESEFKTRYDLEKSLKEPIEVEVQTVAIDDRPIGLNEFPLVATIWNYLDGKEARSMKQIRDAMRKTERITEDDLKAKFPNVEGYSDALKNVIQFGVGRGYLREVSEDTYEAIRKH